jgi:hypothetical protein
MTNAQHSEGIKSNATIHLRNIEQEHEVWKPVSAMARLANCGRSGVLPFVAEDTTRVK